MSAHRLLKLREWLTTDEAANELSKAMGEYVSEADVLRLALEGHLKVSVNLPGGADAKCSEIDSEERSWTARRIDGLWDLAIVGAGRRQLEHRFNFLRQLPFISMEDCASAIVERAGVICKLPPDRGGSGFSARTASAVPEGGTVVVRRSVLEEFIAQMAPSSPPTIPDPLEKTVGQRERTTLLTIIAALAKEAKIDVTTPSAAGVAVEALTEAMNVRVPARTVEEHLKRIPDALERRAKTSS